MGGDEKRGLLEKMAGLVCIALLENVEFVLKVGFRPVSSKGRVNGMTNQ